MLIHIADNINTLGAFCGKRDVLAQAMRDHIAKKYVIVGGAGHTTETLRLKMHEEFPEHDPLAGCDDAASHGSRPQKVCG